MEYFRGFSLFRQDPQWTSKLMWACLLLLSALFVPILGQVVFTGWMAMIMRRAVHGIHTPLPPLEMNGELLGKLLGVGFKGFIVRFLWQLPYMFIVGGFGIGLYALLIVTMMSGGGVQTEQFLTVVGIYSLVMLVVTPLSLVLLIPSQAATIRAELTDDLSQGLDFKEVMAFSKRQFWTLLKGTVILGFASTLLVLAGVMACYVGAFPAAVVAGIANMHFLAQVYEKDVAEGGTQLPVASPEIMPASASLPISASLPAG